MKLLLPKKLKIIGSLTNNNSLVTITDLLEADVSLLQAKLNVSLAKADAALAYQKILKTTGSLSK